LGRRARGRGSGNDWNIRHRAAHCHSARERAVGRSEPADARARGAPARGGAGALGGAADGNRWVRGRAGTAHAGTVMCAFTRAGIVCLALLGEPALAAPPTAAPASPPPRIVVAFATQPHMTPGPAGTTGSHDGGEVYRVAQSAQQQARRVAAAYSLRKVAS